MNVVVAAVDDLPGILAMRNDAARWLLDRGIQQWMPGEVATRDLSVQQRRGELFVVRSGMRPVARVRLVVCDRVVWGGNLGVDQRAGYVHGLVTGGEEPDSEWLCWPGPKRRSETPDVTSPARLCARQCSSPHLLPEPRLPGDRGHVLRQPPNHVDDAVREDARSSRRFVALEYVAPPVNYAQLHLMHNPAFCDVSRITELVGCC